MNLYGIDNNSESQDDKEVPDISFEDAMEQLDQTVRALEAGGLTLVEMTALYETGIHLAKLCDEMLKATKLKIEHLSASHEEASDNPIVED